MSHLQHEHYRALKREAVSLDDWWYEGEMASIKREKEKASMKVNGNGNQPARYCWCAELLDAHGNRLPCPPHHDCEYVAARSALVLDAETAALRMPGDFMRNFCREMERRAAPLLNGATDHAGG
jgi:hypothetical protein